MGYTNAEKTEMGLSSSQARLLSLTGRMHDIEYKAQKLEAQKLQMANESTQVYKEYENALNAVKIQYKTVGSDGSAIFNDASYASLCMYQEGASRMQYALADTNTGLIYVSELVDNTYRNAANGEDFALKMSGLTAIPRGAVDAATDLNNIPPQADGNITLNRGQKSAVTVGADPITLTLTNPLGGSNYKYTISSAGGNSAASFEFLNNGRLVIKGSGLTIDAATSDSQKDDIILLGSNNNLNTYGGDDIVRIGTVFGFTDIYNDGSTNNTVNTGSGNDYITNYGGANIINGSDGNDSYMRVTGFPTTSNIENTFVYNDTAVDGNDGWAAQGSLGDCRFLSLINSLTLKNNSLSPYAAITQTGDSYTVVFKNYAEKNNTITVNKNEINASGYSSGDGDLRVMEYALNKLMQQNGDGDLSTCTWNDLSKYVLGNGKMGLYYNTDAQFTKMWNDYKNGTINNLTVMTADTGNPADGIVNNHAYAVKNVGADYVELVNPWDDKDVLRLDMNEFYRYFKFAAVFGSNNYNTGETYYNGDRLNAPTTGVTVRAGDAASDAAKYNYYVRLYNAILAAGGCTIVPNNMINSNDWLTNMINGGFVYIKAVDSDNNWYDTNVATNTNLQEVQNEVDLKKAEAKYESDMRKINSKDKKYDTDLAAMESERNAIKTEIDTLQSVAKDNVDRAFKLFT